MQGWTKTTISLGIEFPQVYIEEERNKVIRRKYFERNECIVFIFKSLFHFTVWATKSIMPWL